MGALLLSGQPASAQPAPEGRSSAPAERASAVRVGTFNINAALPLDQWRQAVQEFSTLVDVGGIQEAAGTEKAAAMKAMPGIGSWRSKRFLQEPVFWNKDAYKLLRGRAAKIADGRKVEDKTGPGLVHQEATLATVVRLRSKLSGETISVVNVHLLSGAVNAGKRLPGVPRRVGMYLDQVRNLGKVVSKEKQWAGGPVWVLGDFNVNYGRDKAVRNRKFAYSTMRRRDLVASWEARKGQLQPGQGSGARSGAYLDVIWSTRKARSVDVLREDRFRISDHFPVVSSYRAP
ncbi:MULTISPECIES: endonuclease/exonuclease/phosphatase family protein [unclassified Nocardioides]|uniref:endonuclease/exonuclease/phosphatase family protein n=1 Tax=unclassified Nocardioides TaxID=2615069 RepID=UPI003607C13C